MINLPNSKFFIYKCEGHQEDPLEGPNPPGSKVRYSLDGAKSAAQEIAPGVNLSILKGGPRTLYLLRGYIQEEGKEATCFIHEVLWY